MGQNFYSWGANNRYFVLELGEYYRLVSAMFLHADILHLLFNMIALYSIGRALESYIGHWRFLVIYCLGGLAGSLASVLLNDATISSVGASGAVFAIFGAEVVFYYRYRNTLGEDARKGLSRAGQTIAINLFIGIRPDTNIDNWGHVGGLIGGGIIALVVCSLFTIKRDPERFDLLVLVNRQPRMFQMIFAASAIVTVVLLATAFSTLAPRTLTLDDFTVNVPGGWHLITDFEGAEFCTQSGTECLFGVVTPSGIVIELDRFSGLGMLLLTLDSFDQSVETAMEAEGATLLSRENTEFDGRDAIQTIYQVGEEKQMFIMFKTGLMFLRFHVEGHQSVFDESRAMIDTFISGVRFTEE
jgi:rhomboid protease GluP